MEEVRRRREGLGGYRRRGGSQTAEEERRVSGEVQGESWIEASKASGEGEGRRDGTAKTERAKCREQEERVRDTGELRERGTEGREAGWIRELQGDGRGRRGMANEDGAEGDHGVLGVSEAAVDAG